MPNILLTQSPNDTLDFAYGPNPVTLTGLTTLVDKYVLQIFKLGETLPVSDIRQTANKVGDAMFDIQSVLQNLIGPSTNNIDGLHYSTTTALPVTRLRIATDELAQYQLKIGYESAGTSTVTLQSEVYTVIGGSKGYWEVDYDSSVYMPEVSGDASGFNCTIIHRVGKALSDNKWRIADTATGDDFLMEFDSLSGIDVQEVYYKDQCTKSFYNDLEFELSMPNSYVRGLEGYWVAQYGSNGSMISAIFLENIQANGGGPNIVLAQGTVPSSNYLINTIACGPANFPIGTLDLACTHYYIIPVVATDNGCTTGLRYMKSSAWRAQRFNIIQDNCLDYSHIQFAWMNSQGMRDQFTFTKKNEKKVKNTKNMFLKEAADYNTNSYSVDVQDRGNTTYSQTLRETYTADTKFINDNQAALLESLFNSPDVMVRFSDGVLADQWQPVNILNNSYTLKTNRKNKLFQYTVNFKLAHNIKSQRG